MEVKITLHSLIQENPLCRTPEMKKPQKEDFDHWSETK